MSTQKVYLGDGVYLTLDAGGLMLSGNRLGERAITLRPAIFKRLIAEGVKHLSGSRKAATLPLLLKLVERTLPDEELDTPAQERTVPLMQVAPNRDEEMNAWEATLRRKREAAAKATRTEREAKPARPITELA